MWTDHRGIVLAILLSLVGVAADTVLKYASLRPSPYASGWFVLGCLMSVAYAVVWVQLMHHAKFASAGLMYSIISALLLLAIGKLLFGETLSHGELAGVLMALGSIMLLGRIGA
jgi:multidrug transporter EmrE-like cation transporter